MFSMLRQTLIGNKRLHFDLPVFHLCYHLIIRKVAVLFCGFVFAFFFFFSRVADILLGKENNGKFPPFLNQVL